MYPFYLAPTTLEEALAAKAEHGAEARIIAGGTDLLIELDREVRKTPNGHVPGLIDLTRIPGLAEIWAADGQIHLGPLVTHNQCVASDLVVEKGFPLARACWEIGAPQIRNRATVAGNVITASPANDAIVPLMALNATVTVQSASRGKRTMPLAQFLTGFRKVDLAPDEILTRISFAALQPTQQGTFIKLGLRRSQAISVITVAAVVDCAGDPATTPLREARISLGAVAPVIVRAAAAEAYLAGKVLTDETIAEAARLAIDSASPIDDIRGSADYRRHMVQTLVSRILRQLRDGQARAGWRDDPVLLWGNTDGKWPVLRAQQAPAQQPSVVSGQSSVVSGPSSIVNGQTVVLPTGMTLLDSLRAAGFVGVKEGCAEGECGACTVFLDGMAVMACLVPAERAVGSEIVTIEGLSDAEQLHPVQQAFIESGGVQCGYCTPGFLMSAAKLLEERPHPTRDEAAAALTGNLCRCTGYRKILDAVVMAGKE
jgi:carbon-monoxide dehydrogenase medium subunit